METTGAAPGAAGKHASPDGFRLDINALRALSVIAVVGFHFQIAGFAGGFVGVDVFLVITGYLMTAKVLNELKLGRFSPWTFWMMRMRRIYPALAVLTIASVIVGWFVTLPAEYLAAFAPGAVGADLLVELRLQERQRLFRHGGADQTTAAHLVAVAGVAVLFLHAAGRWPGLAACFARHVGDQCGGRCAAGLRGPVIGVVSVGKPARCDGIVLLLPAGESLGAVGWRIDRCQQRSGADPKESPIPPGCNRRSSRSPAGCWSRAASSIPCPKRDGPACSRFLPILGAAMIVAARQGAGEGSLLGLSPIQRIGDWSYSIYLWHWPIWVFALSWLAARGYERRRRAEDMMVLASLALGALSYRYVEQPVQISAGVLDARAGCWRVQPSRSRCWQASSRWLS